jgi:hypothetical protein
MNSTFSAFFYIFNFFLHLRNTAGGLAQLVPFRLGGTRILDPGDPGSGLEGVTGIY